MYTFQMNSQVSENGILSIKLSQEWFNKEVNVLLVLESPQNFIEPESISLAAAFDLLTQMPDDFMTERQDDLPQSREEW